MGLAKFLRIVLTITLIALIYVYQQNKIIQLAYQEQERLALLERLVDKNNNLRYNINHRTSLVSIAGIWQEGNFEWPNQRQLVNLYTLWQTSEDKKQIKGSKNIFTHLFQLRSQAEATPVKPHK